MIVSTARGHDSCATHRVEVVVEVQTEAHNDQLLIWRHDDTLPQQPVAIEAVCGCPCSARCIMSLIA